MAGNVEFRVLGPLEVRRDGAEIHLAPRERAVLSVLLLRANAVVSLAELVDALWPDGQPPTAEAAVRNAIAALRRALGGDAIATNPAGYVLHARPEQLDLLRFESLITDARDDPPAEQAQKLREALAHWRGLPLVESPVEPYLQAEIVRLEELHLLALEQRIDADLELGRHAELVPELEALVARHGVRERLWAQLMIGLYLSGRQAEALATYRRAHHTLVDELGIEPGPALRQLQRQILVQEPQLLGRDDTDAVLERAPLLLPFDARGRARALYDYAVALWRAGERLRADAALEHAAREAAGAGDAALEELIGLKLSWQGIFTRGGNARGHLARADRAVAMFEELGDGAKLAHALFERGKMLRDLGRAAEAEEAFERAAALAHAADDGWLAWFARTSTCSALMIGPQPVREAVAHCERCVASSTAEHGPPLMASLALGVVHAEAGNIERGRGVLEAAAAACRELSERNGLSILLHYVGYVEELAGREKAAERAFRHSLDLSQAMADTGMQPTTRGWLGRVLARTGRVDEAEEHLAAARATASPGNLLARLAVTTGMAVLAATRGEHDRARTLADEAVALASPTDWLSLHGDALEQRGIVELAAGRVGPAAASLRAAVELYDRRGNVPAGDRARDRLEKLSV